MARAIILQNQKCGKLVPKCDWDWTCTSSALLDSLMCHILLTPKALIISERSKITNSVAWKHRTDKNIRVEIDRDGCGVRSVIMHVVFVWCAVVRVNECAVVCVLSIVVLCLLLFAWSYSELETSWLKLKCLKTLHCIWHVFSHKYTCTCFDG